ESWSIIKKPLLFEILDSVTNYRGLFQFIDNDNIWSWQFAASACPPKVGTGFGARTCVRQPEHFRRFRSDRNAPVHRAARWRSPDRHECGAANSRSVGANHI